MSPKLVRDGQIQVNRRHWIALAAAAMAGCGGGDVGGGGGSSAVAGLPGTGGTGIFTLGKIAGFGSVIINGIRFDDTSAFVRLDGAAVKSSDLRLGMVAGVMGLRNADLVTGTADSIEIWSTAQGTVTAVDAGCFTVLGMTIEAEPSTVFDGLVDASAVRVGTSVKVWGLQADASAQRWTATRVEAAASAPAVATGLVVVSGARRFLNDIELLGSKAAALHKGELVRVHGTWDEVASALRVERIDPVGVNPAPGSGIEVEIEGVVTALLANGHFMLGTVEVSATGQALPLTGSRIEVYGVWRGQVLEASKIELEDEESHSSAEIEARIEAFTSVSDFVVRGQRCDASDATIKGGQATDLGVGVRVHVKGNIVGDVLRVTELEIDH